SASRQRRLVDRRRFGRLGCLFCSFPRICRWLREQTASPAVTPAAFMPQLSKASLAATDTQSQSRLPFSGPRVLFLPPSTWHTVFSRAQPYFFLSYRTYIPH
ncbi:unnamed protein product, partial [Ectocarpus fasciculatus]